MNNFNRFNSSDLDNLDNIFDNSNDIVDSLDIVNIDIDAIGEEASGKAKTLIEDLANFYYDEEFLKSNPNFRRRVDNDMESLRMLIKMRAADEITHDILLKAIAGNSGNASLYRALSQVQTTILQITTKIETIVNNLTTMIKGYQLELNFKLEQEQMHDSESNSESSENTSILTQHRGSKSFIEHMVKYENTDEPNMFVNEDNEEEEDL